ncbi:glycosyltransferase family 2 protein [Malikia sp.]|uniref:glycosyltransferase family 2 protein n=1 Tax=Malikia sp. TaxID=2070706 RepID=UPI0026392FD0|nr:glycosyltransferase family 2 protein [Malikia sp.]MDD2728586.1 glycosyltransferase family 2 protein [Malikia sp.]
MLKRFISKIRFNWLIDKELKRVSESLYFPQKNHADGTWAVTMVRNESTTLPAIVEHFRQQGISRVLVVNHLSTDDTVESLAPFGDFVQIAQYDHAAYEQRAVMTLASRFATECGASWIIPFDADEIWWPTHGATIAELLESSTADKIPAPHYDFLPPSNPLAKFSPKAFHLRRLQPNPMPKTAFRAYPKAIVLMGNHWVQRPGSNGDGLAVAHYPYRTKDQLRKKVKEGALAIDALGNSKGLGTHWQQWNAMSDEDFDMFWSSIQSSSDVVEDPGLRSLRADKRQS